MSATKTARQGLLGLSHASLTSVTAALRTRYATWARRRAAYLQTLRELDSCSDRELSDIGFSRSDITHIAREAAARA